MRISRGLYERDVFVSCRLDTIRLRSTWFDVPCAPFISLWCHVTATAPLPTNDPFDSVRISSCLPFLCPGIVQCTAVTTAKRCNSCQPSWLNDMLSRWAVMRGEWKTWTKWAFKFNTIDELSPFMHPPSSHIVFIAIHKILAAKSMKSTGSSICHEYQPDCRSSVLSNTIQQRSENSMEGSSTVLMT